MIPQGARLVIVSAFAFSVMTLFVKLIGQRLPSQEIVTARAAVTLALSYVALRRAGLPVLGTRRPLLIVRGVFGFISLSSIYYAVTRMPLAEATVIQYLHPPFTALLAALVLRERVQAATIASIAVSMIGLLVIVQPQALLGTAIGGIAPALHGGAMAVGGIAPALHGAMAVGGIAPALRGGAMAVQALDPLAVAAAISGALFSACAYVTVRKLGEREHPLVIVFYFPLVALPASIPLMWGHAVWPVGSDWLVLLLIGGATQIGQVSFTRALQIDTAGRTASYSYLQVLFAAVWGAAFFAELPSLSTCVGGGLILVGALISVRASLPKDAPSSAP